MVKEDSVVKAKNTSSSLPACDYLLICQISLGMVKRKKCSSICWQMLLLKKSRIICKWPRRGRYKVSSSGNTMLVRFPYGDIDILMLFLLHQFEPKQVLIDNGTGSNRKIIDMSFPNFMQLQRQALAGVHAFSGNDYVSCFFRKGKKKFWDLLTKHERFIQTFADSGLFGHVMEKTKQECEEFVWFIYFLFNLYLMLKY